MAKRKGGNGNGKKRLTDRQKAWLHYYVTPGQPGFLNKGESARLAEYKCKNDNGFYCIGHENHRKLKSTIDRWLNEEGLSEQTLKMRLVDGIEALETKASFDKEVGRWQYSKPMAAWGPRLGYLKLAMQVKGIYGDNDKVRSAAEGAARGAVDGLAERLERANKRAEAAEPDDDQ